MREHFFFVYALAACREPNVDSSALRYDPGSRHETDDDVESASVHGGDQLCGAGADAAPELIALFICRCFVGLLSYGPVMYGFFRCTER
ncbi:hypothetical protein EVAR_26691_1 [Eumeta japonica]|uniref:Uncharacterized protein n=1 Tax=Eumeta variegata TaxID=151549 RepID=A0A4C1VKH7_EUMVA|nr:hypothetical protein EVAR_26691_1 [Eumeta japonica]